MSIAAPSQRAPAGLVPLWFGLIAPPAAWAVQLGVGYALESLACEHSSFRAEWPLHLLTAVCALVTIAAGAVAYAAWRRSRGPASSGGGIAAERSDFMARAGLTVSALFLLMIIFADIAVFAIGMCEKGHG